MERWSSNVGFYLAAIGAAVGLGNIWRFSAVVGANGGGAYLIPYVIAAFVFAVPLFILELSIGRYLRSDVVAAFSAVTPRVGVLGWLVTGGVMVILSYYLVLTGWVLAFMVFALVAPTTTFGAFTGTLQPLVFFAISTVLTAIVVAGGVKSGIERMARYVMPAIFVLLVGMAIFGLTQPGFSEATAFLFVPDFSVLDDPGVWSAAFGQVFFSLSVGQGIMLTYGSYLDESLQLSKAAMIITIADILVAILAGLVIFPIVFSVGGEVTAGTQLAFQTLPAAFQTIPGGAILAVAFFGLLFFAALTSAVSLLEVGVATLVRTTDRSRPTVTVAVTALIFLIGLPSALSYTSIGLEIATRPVLDFVDETVGSFALPLSAIVISLVFSWGMQQSELDAAVRDRWIIPVTRYILPVLLVLVTAMKVLEISTVSNWSPLARLSAFSPPTLLGFLLGFIVVMLLAGVLLNRFVHPQIRRRVGKGFLRGKQE